MLLIEEHKDGIKTMLCDSSNVLKITYDTNTKEMEIVFGNGQKYLYKDVPAYNYIRIRDAESQGKKINELMGKGRGKELYGETKGEQLGQDEIDSIKELVLEAKMSK
jgi:hypothetical protein